MFFNRKTTADAVQSIKIAAGTVTDAAKALLAVAVIAVTALVLSIVSLVRQARA